MVATAVLLLAYVIAPLLALLGAAIIDNVPAPYVPEEGTVKVAVENADVASATVSVLLSTVALAYLVVAAWVAVKYIGSPAATMVIWPVLA